MAIDISNNPDVVAWKAKWQSIGLQDTLLNAMISEANAEYNSTIGFGDINRFANLTVNIVDNLPHSDTEYLIGLFIEESQTQGKITTLQTWVFPQVPCVNIYVIVCKLRIFDAVLVGFASLLISHSKDEIVTINLQGLDTSMVEADYTTYSLKSYCPLTMSGNVFGLYPFDEFLLIKLQSDDTSYFLDYTSGTITPITLSTQSNFIFSSNHSLTGKYLTGSNETGYAIYKNAVFLQQLDIGFFEQILKVSPNGKYLCYYDATSVYVYEGT